MLNSILDGSSKYPSPRSLSVLLLDNSKELLTLENNTIMDVYILILTVVSTDLINTYYQTSRSKHCVKQVLGPFLRGRESMLKAGLKAGLYYRS